jgi:hypothetical protein
MWGFTSKNGNQTCRSGTTLNRFFGGLWNGIKLHEVASSFSGLSVGQFL